MNVEPTPTALFTQICGSARRGRPSTDPWRATFYTTGMEHSITSPTASAWEPTPWHAVQGAAREALSKTAS